MYHPITYVYLDHQEKDMSETKLTYGVKYQFSDIGSSNQLSMKHKWCIFKQTRSFAGNILERRTLASRDKL